MQRNIFFLLGNAAGADYIKLDCLLLDALHKAGLKAMYSRQKEALRVEG